VKQSHTPPHANIRFASTQKGNQLDFATMQLFVYIAGTHAIAQIPEPNPGRIPQVPPSENLRGYTTSIKLAAAAYCPVEEITTKQCLVCREPEFQRLQQIRVGENPHFGILWFTAYDEQQKTIVVSYRGSDNIMNLIQNVNPLMERLPGGERIQAAYLAAVRSPIGPLSQEIGSLIQLQSSSSILFTGHSAGAAFATIAMYLGLQPDGFLTRVGFAPDRISLVGIAGPRFADGLFASRLAQIQLRQAARLVNDNDPVPLVPFEQIGYRHSGKEILIDPGSNTMTTCSSLFRSTRDGTCSSAFKLPTVTGFPRTMMEAHNHYLGIALGDNACGVGSGATSRPMDEMSGGTASLPVKQPEPFITSLSSGGNYVSRHSFWFVVIAIL
jgi:hypothetical protein